MSGEVNMIPTLRKFRGGPVQANLGGGQSRGEAQLKKTPCMRLSGLILVRGDCLNTICLYHSEALRPTAGVSGNDFWAFGNANG